MTIETTTTDTVVPPVTDPVVTTEQQPEKTYSQSDYDLLVKKAAAAEKIANDLAAKAKADQETKLRENKSWQELAALKETEATEAKARADKLSTAFIAREKGNSLREEALKAGIKKEALADLRLLDFPELSIQTNSEGEVIVSGADKAIQRMKTIRPYWFGSTTPTVNSTTPGVTHSSADTVSWDVLMAANKKAEQTGNYTEYKELLLKYKAQTK